MRRLLILLSGLFLNAVANAACGDVPFSVQAKAAGAQVIATLPAKYADPANVPKPATAALGAEYVRSMYGAMGPTVVRTVLSNYTCRFAEAVDADQSKTPDEKVAIKSAFQDAVDDLSSSSALYFTVFAAQNFDQAQALKPTLTNSPALVKEARVPVAYLNASVNKIADNSFLIESSYAAYGSSSLKGVELTACGKYIRAALAENASTVQQLAASLRSTLMTYFDNVPSSVRSAKTKLFMEAASAATVTPPARTENKALVNACAV